MAEAVVVPVEESTDDELVLYLARDIRQGDNYTYVNLGRERRGTVDRIDTHDKGSVGTVIDITGVAVCRIDSSTVVKCYEEDALVLRVGHSGTLVVNPPNITASY